MWSPVTMLARSALDATETRPMAARREWPSSRSTWYNTSAEPHEPAAELCGKRTVMISENDVFIAEKLSLMQSNAPCKCLDINVLLTLNAFPFTFFALLYNYVLYLIDQVLP